MPAKSGAYMIPAMRLQPATPYGQNEAKAAGLARSAWIHSTLTRAVRSKRVGACLPDQGGSCGAISRQEVMEGDGRRSRPAAVQLL